MPGAPISVGVLAAELDDSPSHLTTTSRAPILSFAAAAHLHEVLMLLFLASAILSGLSGLATSVGRGP